MAGSVTCYVNSQGETVCYDILTGESAAPPSDSGYTVDSNGNVISPPPVPKSAVDSPPAETLAPPPGAVPSGTAATEGGFQPKGAILDIVRLPDGSAQVIYRPNLAGVAPPPDFITSAQYAQMVAAAPGAGGGGISPTAIYQQQQAAAQNAIRNAEDARQFNEQLGFQKAQFDQRAVSDAADRVSREALTREQLDVSRGNTLLGLGSRPETVIRYLYALGGRQAPQQLNGVAPALPGYPGTNALPVNPAQPALSGAPNASAAPPLSPASTNLPAENFGAPRLGQPGAPNVLTNENLTLAAQNPSLSTAIGLPNVPYLQSQVANGAPLSFSPLVPNAQGGGRFANSLGQIIGTGPGNLPDDIFLDPTTGSPQSRTAIAASDAIKAADPTAEARQQQINEQQSYEEREFRGYADGGPIPEMVVGVGMDTGKPYLFGENGVEHVVPEGKKLSDVKGKRPRSRKYQNGGDVGGYAPDYAPKAVFNPPALSDIVSRGYNTPGVPLMPQVATLTGGGQSLIPSSQALFRALPSERASYQGFLQDEAGVMPEDVFELTRRLAPQVTGLRTPRFAE